MEKKLSELGWVSIRNQFPTDPGVYEVYDSRNGKHGKAEYDGFQWHEFVMEGAQRGSLMLQVVMVTHWRHSGGD